MDCVCGCGAKVPRSRFDANEVASQIALELLAWDKLRATNPPAAAEVEGGELLIEQGAGCYRRLLAAIHGEEPSDPVPEAGRWLQDASRRRHPEMVDRGSFFSPAKLRLSDGDIERIDRRRPELSFSRDAPPAPDARPSSEPDPVRQLEALATLHSEGILTDQELAAAKARVTDTTTGQMPFE